MRLCVVCPGAADLFAPAGGGAGGSERQLVLLGRELARRGHAVTFVVRRREGLSDPVFRLVPVNVRRSLAPGLRKLVHAARFWEAMERADADVYVLRGADTLALDVGLFARTRRRTFVFMAASDADFLSGGFNAGGARRVLFRQGLRLADAVVVQTDRQRALARERCRRSAVVVPNAVEIPAAVPPPGREVLWAGALRSCKRPDAVLALARALPQVPFTVVGGVPDTAEAAAARAFLREAGRLPNIRCEEARRPEAMDLFYARAALVINTSPVEGFPNVLLEGWARGRPAVTDGVDPDGAIRRHGLGIVARGPDALARAVAGLLADPARRLRMGADARRYVETRHAPGLVVDRLERVLAGLRPRG